MYRTLYLAKNSFGGLGKVFAPKTAGVTLKKNAAKYGERLKKVKILNTDWKNVLRKYNSPQVFAFLDPPYSDPGKAKWTYQPFQTNDLIPTLKKWKGRFLLTFQSTAANRRAFKNAGFKVGTIRTSYGIQPDQGSVSKTELVVTNY